MSWGHVDDSMLTVGALPQHDTPPMAREQKADPAAVFRRALSLQKSNDWNAAGAAYAEYIRIVNSMYGGALSRSLADAHYGRALCHAKLGRRLKALLDLDECIKLGPEDEQLTEEGISCVPSAKVAKCVLCAACPGLEQEAQAIRQEELDRSVAAKEAEEEAADGVCLWEGKLWKCPLTRLDVAAERARAASKTPLLLDETGTADVAFLYQQATVVEAKALVLEVRAPYATEGAMEAAREKLRKQLVHAMQWGHTLVIRMSDTAAGFLAHYCHEDYFPKELFDINKLPSGKDAEQDEVFCKVLRDEELTDTGGRCPVPPTFTVVVTSMFSIEKYEERLSEALPFYEAMQPVHLFELTEEQRTAEMLAMQQNPSNTGPLSDVVADWGGAYKVEPARTVGDAPKAGQLKGDRISLYESN